MTSRPPPRGVARRPPASQGSAPSGGRRRLLPAPGPPWWQVSRMQQVRPREALTPACAPEPAAASPLALHPPPAGTAPDPQELAGSGSAHAFHCRIVRDPQLPAPPPAAPLSVSGVLPPPAQRGEAEAEAAAAVVTVGFCRGAPLFSTHVLLQSNCSPGQCGAPAVPGGPETASRFQGGLAFQLTASDSERQPGLGVGNHLQLKQEKNQAGLKGFFLRIIQIY